jgi:hypothetical protein
MLFLFFHRAHSDIAINDKHTLSVKHANTFDTPSSNLIYLIPSCCNQLEMEPFIRFILFYLGLFIGYIDPTLLS